MPDLSAAFVLIAQLALVAGNGQAINRLPGAWSYAFTSTDERGAEWRWQIAVNGHREPVLNPFAVRTTIDPFDAHVHVNGWPFAVINPYGGSMGHGEGANEDTFIAAIEAETERLRGVPV